MVKHRKPLLYPQQDSCLTNKIVQLPVTVFAHGQVILAKEGCAGISCQVAVGSPAVQLFVGKLDPPPPPPPLTRSAALPCIWGRAP